MSKLILICCLALVPMLHGPKSFAQESTPAVEPARAAQAPAHYYHVELVVQELGKDGKPTNSRTYTTTVSTDPHDQFTSVRTNSKIPIVTGSFSSSAEANAPVNTQYQYQNVGVNLDLHHAREIGRQLSFELEADISSVAETPDATLHQPIIRQNRWQAVVLIPIGKPTVVCTSDTLDSKGSMQLMVTATLLQ